MAGPHFKWVHNKRDSCKKHFGRKKNLKNGTFAEVSAGRAGPGRFGVRFFRHNFGNRRASRAGITMNKLRGSSRNPVAPRPDSFLRLFSASFSSTPPKPNPAPPPLLSPSGGLVSINQKSRSYEETFLYVFVRRRLAILGRRSFRDSYGT